MADQSLAEVQAFSVRPPAFRGVACEEHQAGRVIDHFKHIKLGVLGGHDRRQLGQDQPADRIERLLPLQHAAELGQIGLEPVLLGILLRRVAQVADHFIDRVLQGRNLALRLHRDRTGQVALRHRGGHLRNRAHLGGQVFRKLVDVLGEPFPGSGCARHLGLPAELALDADFPRHAGDLLRENRQRVDHAVDGVGQRRDFALRLYRQLLFEVAVGHGGHHFRDAAHLAGQVPRHGVDAVGQVFPGSRNAPHLGLAAEAAVRADLACHPRHFRAKRAQLVHHGVDGVLQFQNLALHVHRDLLRQIALRHRSGHVRNVAHLGGQVARHGVDAFGQVLPGSGDALHVGLAAKLAFGSDFARHARHLRGKGAELVHHGVDGVLQLLNFAFHVHGDFLGQVAGRDRGRHFRDIAHLRGQVARHRVDAVGQILPGSGNALHVGLSAQPALCTHLARDPRHLGGERAQLVYHRVDRVLHLQNLALHIHGDLLGQVPIGYRGGHVRDVAHLGGQVARHGIDAVGQVLPRTRHTLHFRLTAEAPFGTDLARHPRHLRRERAQLVHHGVDGVLQLGDLAFYVHRDFLRQVARCHRGGHVRDVAHLGGQVARHGVDAFGQVLPGSGDALHVGLAAKLAFGSDFARHARHLRGKGAELVHHGVDGVLQLLNFAFHVHGDFLGQVAGRDRGRHFRDIAHLRGQVARHRIDAVGQVLPRA